MRHHRHTPAERVIDLLLARGVGEVVVAADDVGDTHVMVVDNDREHVGRRAVRAQQYEIVEIFILPCDTALHLVVDGGFAAKRRLEPDHRFHARWCVSFRTVAPASVVKLGAALATRRLTHPRELLRAGKATIGEALREQVLCHLAVAGGTGELIDRITVPGDAEPLQAIENGGNCRVRGALAVGILDPQQHFAPAPARVEPVEQRRTGAPDVEKSGRRRRKTGDDRLGHVQAEEAVFKARPVYHMREEKYQPKSIPLIDFGRHPDSRRGGPRGFDL